MIELLQALLLVAVAALGYFIKRIMDDTQALRTEMKPITPAIVEIQGKFTDAGHTLLFPVTVTPGSPLKLTEYGQKLIDDSGFEKILADCRNELVEAVKAKNPTTNYDIQQDSKTVIQELLDGDDDKLKPLKSYAFNNGLNVNILVPPAGIVLRDEVMKELKFDDED